MSSWSAVSSAPSSSEPDSQLSKLEPFLLLANSARGLAASQLCVQAVEANGVFVFGELLHHPALSLDDAHRLLLEIFAYGTHEDYVLNKDKLPALSPQALHKLRLLTLATLAASCSELSYDAIKQSLGLDSDMAVESLVIEAISLGVMSGKLDQKASLVLVSHAMARDVRKKCVSAVREKLELWCRSCDEVLSSLQQQVDKANEARRNDLAAAATLESRIAEQRSRLRAQQQQSGETDDPDSSLRMETDQQLQGRGGASESRSKEAKKMTKGKAMRNGGASKGFWKHN